MDYLSMLMMFFMFAFPFFGFILLPISFKTSDYRSKFRCYFGSLVVTLIVFSMMLQGVKTSCSIDESECLGSTAAAYLIGIYQLIFVSIGTIFFLLSYVKMRRGVVSA
jgi:hypothetical protein